MEHGGDEQGGHEGGGVLGIDEEPGSWSTV